MTNPSGAVTWVDDRQLRVGDLDFYCDLLVTQAPPGRLPVMKRRELVDRYIELSLALRPSVIVELGIRKGGSTALLNELTHPDTLVAIEIAVEPAIVLTGYIDERGVAASVRPFYGVDQADRPRVEAILDQEIGDRPIDLVVDDASHLYAETLSSFETLFPRMATGAPFVIEDWNGTHLVVDEIQRALDDTTRPDHDALQQHFTTTYEAQLADPAGRPAPLTRLAVELIVARASLGDVIRDVTVNDNWIIVRRGADPIDRDTFKLADHVNDHFGFIPTH